MTVSEIANNALLAYMAKVGVGQSGSKQLSREEARQAMEAVLSGNFHPVTFGAFFMGLRYKGELPDELAGFLDAMYAAQVKPAVRAPEGTLSCAGAYDGKARTLNIGIAAALVTAAAGVPVVLHGTRGVPTKFGMTTNHVLTGLRISTDYSIDEAVDCLHRVGIAYVDQAAFNPALHRLLSYRTPIGKRTIINTMETLSNPAGARYHVGGFFHDPYADLVTKAMASTGMPFGRVMMVKGIEGSDELRPGGVYIAKTINGICERESVDSDALGLPIHISELSAPTDSLENRVAVSIEHLKALMENPTRESAYRNAVILNAGLRLYAADKAGSLSEAIARAKETLTSGTAGEVLRRWQGS